MEDEIRSQNILKQIIKGLLRGDAKVEQIASRDVNWSDAWIVTLSGGGRFKIYDNKVVRCL